MSTRVRLTAHGRSAADQTPYPGNVNQPDRKDPAWDQYHTFEQRVNHELPDMRHQWQDDSRDDIGFGVPEAWGKQPTVASVRVAANKAIRVAILLLGDKVADEVIEAQSLDLMAMGPKAMDRTMQRFAETQALYADDKADDKAEEKDEAKADEKKAADEKVDEKKEDEKKAADDKVDEKVDDAKKDEEKKAADLQAKIVAAVSVAMKAAMPDFIQKKIDEKEEKKDDAKESKKSSDESEKKDEKKVEDEKKAADEKDDKKKDDAKADEKKDDAKADEKKAADDKADEKVEDKEEEKKASAPKTGMNEFDIELTGAMEDEIAPDEEADERLASLFDNDGLAVAATAGTSNRKVEASQKSGIKKLGGQPRVASAQGGGVDISSIWQSAPDVSEAFK